MSNLVAQMSLTLSHTLQRMSSTVQSVCLQYGIVVVGFIDAFVCAHNHYRRNIENPGNFGDCMKGRMNPFHDSNHCLCSSIPGTLPDKTHACDPKPEISSAECQSQIPHLPNVRTATHERGNDFQVWAIHTDGRTRLADGETYAGWGAVARSPHGRMDVMFGPVITTEAPLEFAGAGTHSNNTAEMTAMVEALWSGCS